MNDTISRKQAIETLIAEANAEGAYGYLDAKSIEDCLTNMPSTEPERKTGRWIKHRYAEEAWGMLIDNYECSICHTWERKYSNFCPECGAQMWDWRKMNNCKHCMEIKENEIGETVAFCEFSDQWENVTLGSCFGNCEGQEFTADYIAQRLNQLSDCAYDWHIDNKVVGIDVCEFEQLMDVAAKMILEAEPKRKTGRWIKPTGMMPPEYHGHYECSECGAWAMCTYHKSKVKLTRYCPGCGIKMENADV